MAGILIDRFGKDIPMLPISPTHFEVSVNVALSPMFYGWLTSLGGGIRLTGPAPAVHELKQYIQRLYDAYLR